MTWRSPVQTALSPAGLLHAVMQARCQATWEGFSLCHCAPPGARERGCVRREPAAHGGPHRAWRGASSSGGISDGRREAAVESRLRSLLPSLSRCWPWVMPRPVGGARVLSAQTRAEPWSRLLHEFQGHELTGPPYQPVGGLEVIPEFRLLEQLLDGRDEHGSSLRPEISDSFGGCLVWRDLPPLAAAVIEENRALAPVNSLAVVVFVNGDDQGIRRGPLLYLPADLQLGGIVGSVRVSPVQRD